jgi:hypothetical protein
MKKTQRSASNSLDAAASPRKRQRIEKGNRAITEATILSPLASPDWRRWLSQKRLRDEILHSFRKLNLSLSLADEIELIDRIHVKRVEMYLFLPTVFAYPLLASSMAMMVVAGTDSRSLIGRYAIPGAGPLASGAYSLYLSHKAVFQAVRNALSHAPAPIETMGLAVAVLAALAVGAALYWLVERPFLNLRDRLEGPSRSSLASPASTPVIAR